MRILFFLISILTFSISFAQSQPTNGAKESKPSFYALEHATIYISPDNVVTNATLLIKNDKIIDAGRNVKIPKGAVVIDCKGKTILPAFIELNSAAGLPDLKRKSRTGRPQYESTKAGSFYWNEAIHPEVTAESIYANDTKKNDELIQMGFGYALTHQNDGIAQGEGAFIALNNEKSTILPSTLSSFYSFRKGISQQAYPSSQMGAIALLRQTYYDAEWYKNNREETNISLDHLLQQMGGSLFFQSYDKLEILRAVKIAEEFNLHYNFIGSGNEYGILKDLKNSTSTIILPINFPKAFDVNNPYIARQIPLKELKYWEMAPKNPMILRREGIDICISSMGHKKASVFWKNLRTAINQGLSEEDALKALTVQPAILTGTNEIVGTLEKGKIASFIVYDENPFQKKATILETWMLGQRNKIAETTSHQLIGKYNLNVAGKKFPFEISGNSKKYKGTIHYKIAGKDNLEKDTSVDLTILSTGYNVTLHFAIFDKDWSGSVNLQGKANDKFGVFEGEGMIPTGEWVKWSAIKTKKTAPKAKETTKTIQDTTYQLWFPDMAYGFDTLPEEQAIVIKNATLWTNEEDGILENATIVIHNGKITHVGTGNYRKPANAIVIDAKGKHVTSGIIDEHSHIAISRGVNESGQAVSAEVRIGDVLNPEDINIYRQLSGGVTASQLLHGSANPIGGQAAFIKLRWGVNANELLVKDADPFIKFALGENVKQSNWGSYNNIRFPQTRMGVEQLYFDAFLRAQNYELLWKEHKKSGKNKPRVDLELQTLSEILQSNRFITCHSYIQSEINMLMHVADTFGFTINTFTHILEGYKVADLMVKHGVGGSTFSDWWAYKYEVNDAIPYNAALMSQQGIVVAINSDDAEMGRRLNQEAAKGVKYGGMTEIDAWKMVTLNPAKLLHVDDRMGSLKVGKDADIVIWTDNPLSIRAIVEYTIVDGIIRYSQETDEELRKRNQAEKARIISLMLLDESDDKRLFVKKKEGHFHCNTIGEEVSTEENKH